MVPRLGETDKSFVGRVGVLSGVVHWVGARWGGKKCGRCGAGVKKLSDFK